MDKKLKTKWVKALRSGNYRRARTQLKQGRGYCCLGVLCEVANLLYERSAGALNSAQLETVGLTEVEQMVLIGLNDGCLESSDGAPPKGYQAGLGASFRVIADWIEEHV